jgi:putative phosphonate metabolism protein
VAASNERFAIYFAPAAASPLWREGCRWLGRDPDIPRSGHHPESPPVETPPPEAPPEALDAGVTAEDWLTATAEPRRYGFHATLKPPFRLVEGADLADLDDALAKFAAGRRAFVAPGFEVTGLDGFLALCPAGPVPALDDLAADCVRAFEPFRRPPEPEELARRRQRGLSRRQEELLVAWGYPYLMEEFRFHLTLTGRLDGAAAGRFLPLLQGLFAAALSTPPLVEGVSLFREPEPGAPFETMRRYLFKAA